MKLFLGIIVGASLYGLIVVGGAFSVLPLRNYPLLGPQNVDLVPGMILAIPFILLAALISISVFLAWQWPDIARIAAMTMVGLVVAGFFINGFNRIIPNRIWFESPGEFVAFGTWELATWAVAATLGIVSFLRIREIKAADYSAYLSTQ